MIPSALKPFFVAVWTTLTLAGSIYIEFYLIIDVLGVPAMSGPPINMILASLLVLPVPFIAGALWGAGLAVLAGARPWPVMKRGMLSWGWTIVLGGILIDLTQIPVFAVAPRLRFIPHVTHWLFTLVFVPSVGIIVRYNVGRILDALALEDMKQRAGRWSGLAAAAAFLAASIIVLVFFDWEIAGPFAGRRYSMIGIMHVGNFAAALAGGGVLGYVMGTREKESNNE